MTTINLDDSANGGYHASICESEFCLEVFCPALPEAGFVVMGIFHGDPKFKHEKSHTR